MISTLKDRQLWLQRPFWQLLPQEIRTKIIATRTAPYREAAKKAEEAAQEWLEGKLKTLVKPT